MGAVFHLERFFPWYKSEGHSILTKTKSEQKENKDLTPERAFQIFFLSYRFSQGNDGLQQNIWSYLHATNPQWRITEEMEQFMKEKAPSVFETFLWRKEMLHPTLSRSTLQWGESWSGLIGEGLPKELDLKSFLSDNIEKMRNVFNAHVDLTKRSENELVRRILNGIIERDHRFLNRRRRDGGGRPRSKGIEGPTPQADPFLSHICYYALEQHSTGSPEYDQMFQDVKSSLLSVVEQKKHFLIEGELGESFKFPLVRVVLTYRAHHPDPESGLDAFFQKLLRAYPQLKRIQL